MNIPYGRALLLSPCGEADAIVTLHVLASTPPIGVGTDVYLIRRISIVLSYLGVESHTHGSHGEPCPLSMRFGLHGELCALTEGSPTR